MEWPSTPAVQLQQPVFVHAVRPARGRPRLSSEHPNQAFYLQDGNGMLMPAIAAGGQPMYRSVSNRERPASVVIHNTHSPVRGHHRSGSHGHDYYGSDDEIERDHSRSPRRRYRAHSRHSHCTSRSPSPLHYDPVIAARLKKGEELEKAEEEKKQQRAIEERKIIEEIEKQEKEKKQRERYEEEKLLEAERKRLEAQEEQKRKEEWIAQWKLEEEEKKKKEEEKKKKEDEESREKTYKALRAIGYSDQQIEKILRKTEKNEKQNDGQLVVRVKDDDLGVQVMRPTYIKVHKKYMSRDTLKEFGLPFYEDTDYLIIKQWISEHDQETLFRHTAELREKKARKKIEATAIEVRKDGNNNLALVQKKEPGRSRSRPKSRAWIFT